MIKFEKKEILEQFEHFGSRKNKYNVESKKLYMTRADIGEGKSIKKVTIEKISSQFKNIWPSGVFIIENAIAIINQNSPIDNFFQSNLFNHFLFACLTLFVVIIISCIPIFYKLSFRVLCPMLYVFCCNKVKYNIVLLCSCKSVPKPFIRHDLAKFYIL